ncbi:MAG: hypothetical protein M1376_11410 [Planctomycetes bacterium]|nr:hypothetical protein [Planctomycetota bacterium]
MAKQKKTKPGKALDGKAEPPSVGSFTELNWRSARLALGWIITVVDLYFTNPKGAGSHPCAAFANGQFVRNPIRDFRAEASVRELRHNAEAVRTVHPELALSELPKPTGDADSDVGLIGQWARAALVRMKRPKTDVAPVSRKEITLAEFLREYCCEPLKKGRLASVRERLQKAARRKPPLITLPPVTRPAEPGHERGHKKYYPPEALVQNWAEYQERLPGLPDLKPEYVG